MNTFDENSHIDRHFGNDLRAAGRGERPDPGEWERLAIQLDGLENGRSTPRFRYLLPLALLLFLLASTGLVSWKWLQADREIMSLKSEFAALKMAAANSLPADGSGSETHRATVIFDTIYRTVVIRKTVLVDEKWNETALSDSKTAQAGSVSENGKNPTTPLFSTKEGGRTTGEKEAGSANLYSDSTQNAVAKQEEVSKNQPTPTGMPSQVQAENRQPDSPGMPDADSLRWAIVLLTDRFDSLMKVAAPPAVHHLARPRFQVTGGLAWLFPSGISNLETGAHTGFFAAGEAQFGRHWALGMALGVEQIEFKVTEKYDPRLLVLPPVSPGTDFDLNYIESYQQVLLPEITASYRFLSSGKWSPRLTAGWGFRLLKNQKTEYDFRNPTTGTVVNYFETDDPWRSRANQVSLRAGISRVMAGRWSAFCDAGGLFDLGRGQRGATFGGLRLGLAAGL